MGAGGQPPSLQPLARGHESHVWLVMTDQLADLLALPPSAQPDRGFDYWILKESYVKTRGLGFQLPLDRFSFHLTDHTPIRISFGPRITDDPTRWQFDLQRVTPRHRLAVAVSRHHEPDLAVRLLPVVPGEAMDC